MTFQVTRITTRLDMATPFYRWPESELKYIEHTYDDTGKTVDKNFSISEDKLTTTAITSWASEDDWQIYLADSKIKAIHALRNAYNSEHGIVETVTTRLV